MEALLQHQQLCDELHALALEENRFLQQHRRLPDPELIARKQSLLTRLDESLAALRTAPRGGRQGTTFRNVIEKTRTRILQLLQVDRENEQLLLRFSLTAGRPAVGSAAQPPTASLLQNIYQRHR
jgi:hypothetical protein